MIKRRVIPMFPDRPGSVRWETCQAKSKWETGNGVPLTCVLRKGHTGAHSVASGFRWKDAHG